MQNDDLSFKLDEPVKFREEHLEREEKLFANLETNRIQQSFGDIASTSTGRQQRKSKKPTKALQLDNFQTKKVRSHQSNCMSTNNQFNYDSAQSSSSSTSNNSPAGSPGANLFNSNSLGNTLGSLTNTVNSSSLNSTNRNAISSNLINEIAVTKQTNSDHLNLTNNPSQSIFPITFMQKNLITSPAMNKQFNFKTNKPQQSTQQTAQLSTLINNTGKLSAPLSVANFNIELNLSFWISYINFF